MNSNAEIATAVAALGDTLVEKMKIHFIEASATPFDLEFGNSYHVTGTVDIVLPAGRDTDGFIRLSKQSDVSAINVLLIVDSADLLEISGISDTGFVYDVSHPIVLRWISATSKWVI